MTFMKKPITGNAILLAAFLVPMSGTAATFDIQVTYTGGLTLSQQNMFSAAEAFWEKAITGYTTAFAVSALAISAAGVAIDGVGGVLGSAGPVAGFVASDVDIYYATKGTIQLDTADLVAAEAGGSLFNIILHEMAHVIGFGTLWNTKSMGGAYVGTQSVYAIDTGEYTGSNALATYQVEFDPLATFIPVELDGGPGTANSHWDEAWAGGPNELMTGFLNMPTFVSDTTIASFADIGYTVNLAANDVAKVPLPASLALMGLGLGLMGWARRRSAFDIA